MGVAIGGVPKTLLPGCTPHPTVPLLQMHLPPPSAQAGLKPPREGTSVLRTTGKGCAGVAGQDEGSSQKDQEVRFFVTYKVTLGATEPVEASLASVTLETRGEGFSMAQA